MTSEAARWSAGDHVIFRQVWPGGVWAAIPATVIEDGPSLVAVYVRPGTRFAGPLCTREEHLRVAAGGTWELQVTEWAGQHHLWTAVPGEPCSVWTMWSDPDWTHLGWKLNPEAPWTRTSLGFDTTDYALDVVIPPDLGSWTWKDEDDFAEAIELGLIAPATAARVRERTAELAEQALAGEREALEMLAEWRPPPDWEMPVLAGEWASVAT